MGIGEAGGRNEDRKEEKERKKEREKERKKERKRKRKKERESEVVFRNRGNFDFFSHSLKQFFDSSISLKILKISFDLENPVGS